MSVMPLSMHCTSMLLVSCGIAVYVCTVKLLKENKNHPREPGDTRTLHAGAAHATQSAGLRCSTTRTALLQGNAGTDHDCQVIAESEGQLPIASAASALRMGCALVAIGSLLYLTSMHVKLWFALRTLNRI